MTPDGLRLAQIRSSVPTAKPGAAATFTRRAAIAAIALFWADAVAIAEEPTAAGAAGPASGDLGSIAVELNRTEPVEDGCRLSFVIRNLTSHAFESMQWDLFFFDPEGLIAGRTAAEAAPLRAGKTSVKLFDLPDLACNNLGRVLINDVLRCETKSSGGAEIDCLGLTVPSSRARVELIK